MDYATYKKDKRFKENKKFETEECQKLTIFCLNKNNCLKDGLSGDFTFGSQNFKIYFSVVLNSYEKYIQFSYTCTDLNENKTSSHNYKIYLTTTKCNYGGHRFWFTCPLSVDGKYCSRRVGVLYKPPYIDYFGCRTCLKLAYKCNNLSGNQKLLGTVSYPELLELRDKVNKRMFYRGKLTKKYKSYVKKVTKLRDSVSTWKKNFVKKYSKTKG